MDKQLYDGRGDAEGRVFWLKDDGQVVGRPYVRQRTVTALAKWRGKYSLTARRATVAATIESERWMIVRAGQTVGSIVRDVEESLLQLAPDMAPMAQE